MVWGIEGDTVDARRLKPLGLICYGGSSKEPSFIKNREVTYHVVDGFDFNVELIQKDFDNVEIIYKRYLRIKKLNRINNI